MGRVRTLADVMDELVAQMDDGDGLQHLQILNMNKSKYFFSFFKVKLKWAWGQKLWLNFSETIMNALGRCACCLATTVAITSHAELAGNRWTLRRQHGCTEMLESRASSCSHIWKNLVLPLSLIHPASQGSPTPHFWQFFTFDHLKSMWRDADHAPAAIRATSSSIPPPKGLTLPAMIEGING